jgi:hypothetical protein
MERDRQGFRCFAEGSILIMSASAPFPVRRKDGGFGQSEG